MAIPIPKWIIENWEGCEVVVEDPFGITFRVPAWKCKYCGFIVGSKGAPPKTCPKCNHSSGETVE